MSFKKNFCGFCIYKMLKHSLEPWSRSWQPSHWAVTPPASPRPPNMKVSLYTCNVNVTWSIVEVLWYIWHVDFWTYQESTITATIERTEMIGIKQMYTSVMYYTKWSNWLIPISVSSLNRGLVHTHTWVFLETELFFFLFFFKYLHSDDVLSPFQK